MKITVKQLKQLIKEQVEEAQELAKAYKAAGSPAPKPAQSQVDNQATKPQQPALEEEVEETVQENVRKMVREALKQLIEKKKGLPPWLTPGFKDKKNKEEEDETDEDEKDEEDKKSLKDKKEKSSKLDEARLMDLIKEAIKQNLNEKSESDPKWLSKAGKEIAKKGTEGALHKDLGVAKDKNIPVETLNKKKAALQKKGEGEKKMSAEDRKELRRVQFAINTKKAKK